MSHEENETGHVWMLVPNDNIPGMLCWVPIKGICMDCTQDFYDRGHSFFDHFHFSFAGRSVVPVDVLVLPYGEVPQCA